MNVSVRRHFLPWPHVAELRVHEGLAALGDVLRRPVRHGLYVVEFSVKCCNTGIITWPRASVMSFCSPGVPFRPMSPATPSSLRAVGVWGVSFGKWPVPWSRASGGGAFMEGERVVGVRCALDGWGMGRRWAAIALYLYLSRDPSTSGLVPRLRENVGGVFISSSRLGFVFRLRSRQSRSGGADVAIAQSLVGSGSSPSHA